MNNRTKTAIVAGVELGLSAIVIHAVRKNAFEKGFGCGFTAGRLTVEGAVMADPVREVALVRRMNEPEHCTDPGLAIAFMQHGVRLMENLEKKYK